MHLVGGIVVLALVIAAGALLAKDALLEWANRGTTKGLVLCEARGRKDGVTSALVHERCRDKHAQPVAAALKGTGGYVNLSDILGAMISFQGRVTNESPDLVVTEYAIEVHHSARADMSFSQLFKDKWLEPNASDAFAMPAKRLTAPPTQDAAGGDAWADAGSYQWSISGIKGVRLAF